MDLIRLTTRGDEELALAVIEFSVGRRAAGLGWAAAVTGLIVSTLTTTSSGGNSCAYFLSAALLNRDLRGGKAKGVFFSTPSVLLSASQHQ